MPGEPLGTLLTRVRACQLCAAHLPCGPRPVLQAHAEARILIAGQAPGRKVHASGIPFDDASGERLRAWLGIGRDTFYDPRQVAILPMGFCYPGTGRSGDLPPRPECAPAWRQPLLDHLPHLRLTLVLGQHALWPGICRSTVARSPMPCASGATTAPPCWCCHTPARATTAGCTTTRGLTRSCCPSCAPASRAHWAERPCCSASKIGRTRLCSTPS